MSLAIVPPDSKGHRLPMSELINRQWERMASRIRDPHHDWGASRIGLIGDQVVTVWANFDLKMRIGTARVPTVGVDCVVTDPDHRGKGYMLQTAAAALAAARDSGYVLAILNGITGFYEQFGFVPGWPRRYYTVETKDLPTERPTFALEDFSPNHREELAALYNGENEMLTGTILRPSYRTFKWPGIYSGYLWKNEAECALGYLVGDYKPAAEAGASFTCVDAAGDPEVLVRLAGLVARQLNYEKIRFDRLHYRSPLARYLRQRGCVEEVRWVPSGDLMIAVLDLQGLMERLTDELTLRLSRSHLAGWSGELTVRMGKKESTLVIKPADVSVRSGGGALHGVAGDTHLVRLFVGSDEPEETLSQSATTVWGEAVELIRVLFPAQNPQIAAVDL